MQYNYTTMFLRLFFLVEFLHVGKQWLLNVKLVHNSSFYLLSTPSPFQFINVKHQEAMLLLWECP